MRRIDTLLLAIAAVALLSGCTNIAPASNALPEAAPIMQGAATIPFVRDGDAAIYRNDNYRTFLSIHSEWEGASGLVAAPGPMLKRAYARLDEDPRWPPYREAIDPATNRLLFSLDPCPFPLDGRCKGHHDARYEHFRADVAGLPWGYGSSIFQGRTLRNGTSFTDTFPLGHVVVPVRFTVERSWQEENETRFAIRGVADADGNLTEMVSGNWIVSSASPFVIEYHTTLTLAATRTSTFHVQVNATLVELQVGTGDALASRLPWRAPILGNDRALALEHGLPAGSDLELGLDGYTFGGAWRRLLRDDPDLARDATLPGFRLWNMQVPRQEADGGAFVFRAHHVEGSFSYYRGDAFDARFVSHDCSWIDGLQVELSCEYSGTGPTDGFGGLRGDRRIDESIDLRDAVATASPLLPRAATVFVFNTYTNGIESPSLREERYGFSFFFPLLRDDGSISTAPVLGHVRLDASTGAVRNAIVGERP